MESESIIDQIVKSFAFKVEAVPQKDDVNLSSTSKTPVNLKIKVRKKDNATVHRGVLSVPRLKGPRGPRTVRLVSSDQTVMSFNVFMEDDMGKKPFQKTRKHLFAGCLGKEYDNDDPPYVVNTIIRGKKSADVLNKLDGVLKEEINFAISKNNYIDSNRPKKEKEFFGKCKPGGCLDPPFGEENYSYKLAIPTQEKSSKLKLGAEEIKQNEIKPLADEKYQSAALELMKKIQKSQDVISITKSCEEDIITSSLSILSLYQSDYIRMSLDSKYSDSIITYPPATSPSEMGSEKNMITKNRVPSEDKSRKSYNELSSDTYFMPKNINNCKQSGEDKNGIKDNFVANPDIKINTQLRSNIIEESKNIAIEENNDLLRLFKQNLGPKDVNKIHTNRENLEQTPRNNNERNEKNAPKLSPKIGSVLRSLENDSVKEIPFGKDMNENEIENKRNHDYVLPSTIEIATIEKFIFSRNPTDMSEANQSTRNNSNINVLKDSDIDKKHPMRLNSEFAEKKNIEKLSKDTNEPDSNGNLEITPDEDIRITRNEQTSPVVDIGINGNNTYKIEPIHKINSKISLEDKVNFLTVSSIPEKQQEIKHIESIVISGKNPDKTDTYEMLESEQVTSCKDSEGTSDTKQTRKGHSQQFIVDISNTEVLRESKIMNKLNSVVSSDIINKNILSEKEQDKILSKPESQLLILNKDRKANLITNELVDNIEISKTPNIFGRNTTIKRDSGELEICKESRSPSSLYDDHRLACLDNVCKNNVGRTSNTEKQPDSDTHLLIRKRETLDDQSESLQGDHRDNIINSLENETIPKRKFSISKVLPEYNTKKESITRSDPKKDKKSESIDDTSTHIFALDETGHYNRETVKDSINTDIGSQQFSMHDGNKNSTHNSGQYKSSFKYSTNEDEQVGDIHDYRENNNTTDIKPKQNFNDDQCSTSYSSERSHHKNGLTQVNVDTDYHQKKEATDIESKQNIIEKQFSMSTILSPELYRDKNLLSINTDIGSQQFSMHKSNKNSIHNSDQYYSSFKYGTNENEQVGDVHDNPQKNNTTDIKPKQKFNDDEYSASYSSERSHHKNGLTHVNVDIDHHQNKGATDIESKQNVIEKKNSRSSILSPEINRDKNLLSINTDIGSQQFSMHQSNKNSIHNSSQYNICFKYGTNEHEEVGDVHDNLQQNNTTDIKPEQNFNDDQSTSYSSERSHNKNGLTQLNDDTDQHQKKEVTNIEFKQNDIEKQSISSILSPKISRDKNYLTHVDDDENYRHKNRLSINADINSQQFSIYKGNKNSIPHVGNVHDNRQKNKATDIKPKQNFNDDQYNTSYSSERNNKNGLTQLNGDTDHRPKKEASDIESKQNVIEKQFSRSSILSPEINRDKNLLSINTDIGSQQFSMHKSNKNSIHNSDQYYSSFKYGTNENEQVGDVHDNRQKNNTTDIKPKQKFNDDEYSASYSSERSHHQKEASDIESKQNVIEKQFSRSSILPPEISRDKNSFTHADDDGNYIHKNLLSVNTDTGSEQFSVLKGNKNSINNSGQYSSPFKYGTNEHEQVDDVRGYRQKNNTVIKPKQNIIKVKYKTSSLLALEKQHDNDDYTENNATYQNKNHTANIKPIQNIAHKSSTLYFLSPEENHNKDDIEGNNAFEEQYSPGNLRESSEKKRLFTNNVKPINISKANNSKDFENFKFIDVDLAFQSYINDENKRTVKTIDISKDAQRHPADRIVSIKTQMNSNSRNMKFPIDAEIYMEFGITSNDILRKDSRSIINDANISFGAGTEENCVKKQINSQSITDAEAFQVALTLIYEQQLIPLQNVIKDLRQQVELLANQQFWMKDKLSKSKKSKQLRFTPSNKKCGCSRK